MDSLLSLFIPNEDAENLCVVVLEDLSGRELVGNSVKVRSKRRSLFNKYVLSITPKRLQDVTEEDVKSVSPSQMTTRDFWRHVERHYGGGVPGEFVVSFVGLADKPAKKAPKQKKVATPAKGLVGRSNESLENRTHRVFLKELVSLSADVEETS